MVAKKESGSTVVPAKTPITQNVEKFSVNEIIAAHETFGYAPELIAVALKGCTDLTEEEAKAKIEAFAKSKVKKGVK